MHYFFSFLLVHFALATPQINLYRTNPSDDQHSCLRIATALDQWNINRQILSYCITHSLPESHPNAINDHSPRFTFAELSKANITSEQLYQWSTPIDLIEDYQFYLDQISNSNDPKFEQMYFYNCTLPRFGLRCEYQLDFYHPNHTTIYEIIYDFYHIFPYQPTEFTCYEHLKCTRGPSPSCLDWSEICDGKIDCSNGGIDEEHCWELQVNECGEDEYRCLNGQCIPQSFYLDDPVTPDCLDQSDEPRERYYLDPKCYGKQPSLMCADVACTDMPLTSSCSPQRTNLLVKVIFSIKDVSVSDECWSALKCFLQAPESMDPTCVKICENKGHVSIIDRTCPTAIMIPAVPVLSHAVYFAYEKFDFTDFDCGNHLIPFQCSTIPNYFASVSLTHTINDNYTCVFPKRPYLPSGDIITSWVYSYAIPAHLQLQQHMFSLNYSSLICNRSSMYQCLNSPKCISIHRLMNKIVDCLHADDEDITLNKNSYAIERMKQNSFHCQTGNRYIPLTAVQDGKCDCDYTDANWCEDENFRMNYIRRNISFQTICDGFIELKPIGIDGRNESDETECEQWLCDNIYTRCNGLWNCPNGEDEIGCYQPSSLTCSADQHLCLLNQTFELTCLSIDRINDGQIDCIGGTDEHYLCHGKNTFMELDNFHCRTNRTTECLKHYHLCDRQKNCLYDDDERFCTTKILLWTRESICGTLRSVNLTDVEKFLCDYSAPKSKKQIVRFSLNQTASVPNDEPTGYIGIPIPPKFSGIDSLQVRNVDCHRGLNLQVRSNDRVNSTNAVCLCPTSYYGDRCQYQNQRISLSIQFRVSSDSRSIPFAILISLIDDSQQQVIQSSEQFTYLSIRDCKVKFSIYLLYSTRSKDSNKNYSIQIDIFEKQSLTHRGSLLMPIQFPFLPVHRLSYIVDIPSNNTLIESCSTDRCDHGRCLRYSRSPNNNTFCQCHRGWTGRSCSISHACQCAENAVCAGVDTNNRSVCVCPLDRFGPRCLLRHTACSKNNTCQNGGECIPNDEYAPYTDKFSCICPKGYTGKYCEAMETAVYLSFEPDIMSTQSLFVHFIRVISDNQPQRATTLQTIPFRQQSIVIHWSQPFHLIFVEFPTHNYYLTLAQTTYNRSAVIEKAIRTSDRCRHIRELFNETVMQLHPLRRIKYYQVPCQRDAPDLMCFYDDIHLCLCQDHHRHRVANCFEFNHNMTFNCLGQSSCQNAAECFQDSAACPRRSMCVCGACYYGTQCQFSTTIFGLSLDAVLGYHIQPLVSITKQPLIVQVSAVISIIFVLMGVVNGILALITFTNKSTRNVGCGYYLFVTSIVTLVITVLFGLKFWILVLTQIQVITNRSFLSFQCRTVDYLLRCSLNMDLWLNSCVTMERAMTMVKGARFNRGTSKRTAKWIICILMIFVILTGLDDPIYRRLIDEENEDERRIWCVVSYSSAYQAYDTTMNIFHFVTPFLINLISAITLIVHKSRQKSVLDNDRSYNEIFREELRQHKNLLIAPVVLVILALPHLIFSFASKCMESNSNSWLFLAGYLVSFVPPMLTFVIFILPSKLYKKELRTTVTRYRRHVTRRVNLIQLRSFTLN